MSSLRSVMLKLSIEAPQLQQTIKSGSRLANIPSLPKAGSVMGYFSSKNSLGFELCLSHADYPSRKSIKRSELKQASLSTRFERLKTRVD